MEIFFFYLQTWSDFKQRVKNKASLVQSDEDEFVSPLTDIEQRTLLLMNQPLPDNFRDFNSGVSYNCLCIYFFFNSVFLVSKPKEFM